jgi:perosamine synthetase
VSTLRTFLPIVEPVIADREIDEVVKCLRSGMISSVGPQVAEFEQAFAAALGVPHALSTMNGTVALHLALRAMGVGPGDEVIVPSLTFVSSASAVLHAGATPILVDVNADDWCIDVAAIERAITGRTRAVMPVHLYGHPCEMEQIMALAKRHGLHVVEDAAEALGATCRGVQAGSIAEVGCFSFFANKIITTGEGGMCVTNDDELAEKLRWYRCHCQSPERRYWHEAVGFNYRMTALQASVGLAQLSRLPEALDRKRAVAALYREALAGDCRVRPQAEQAWVRSSWWMFSMTVPEMSGRIPDLQRRLHERGIDSRPLFGPLHKMSPYSAWTGALENSERISECGITLPSSVVMTDAEVEYVALTVLELLDESLAA